MNEDKAKAWVESTYGIRTDFTKEDMIDCYLAGMNNLASFLDEANAKKEEKIKKKKAEFAEMLKPFLPTYGKEMLNEFYVYWSEAHKRLPRLKWEEEKTWETALRLQRWASNNYKKPLPNNNNNQNEPSKKYKHQ